MNDKYEDEMKLDKMSGCRISRYETYYNQVLVKEQPFYRRGMSKPEARKELEYLNDNLEAFYDGSYMPLWKQEWLK